MRVIPRPSFDTCGFLNPDDTMRLSRISISNENRFGWGATLRTTDCGDAGSEWSEMKEREQIGKPHYSFNAGESPEGRTSIRPTSSRRSTGRTQDIDRYVGARIRERRIMLGLTQQQLADLIGVTYQQAHKYERGINRVSAGRLFEVAQVLSVPVSYFFDGLEQDNERAISPRERMCLELARNFAQIPNERHQEALSQLARVLAAAD
jgi:transcriptional regulator with XRE-family HTH domain